MNYEKLFKYMSEEHGITFLESDMQEICNIVNETQGDELQQTSGSGCRQGDLCIICGKYIDSDYGSVCSNCDDSHIDD